MRFLVLALILICSVSGSLARAQTIDPGVREKVLGAKAGAIRVIQEYSTNIRYNQEMRETATYMAELLERSTTSPASKKTMEQCIEDPKMGAGTGLKSQNISFCPYGLSLSKNQITQVFIHESYHLYEGKYYYHIYKPDLYSKFLSNGFAMTPSELNDSESRAARIEFEIMTKQFGCVFFKTEYFRNLLNLVKNRDYVICK